MPATKQTPPTVRATLALVLGLLGTTPLAAQVEGYGAVTQGAESCPTGHSEYLVTSLSDDGSPGTLRDAIHVPTWDAGDIAAKGCRLVRFTVSGEIQLESDIALRSSYVTLDGSDVDVTISQSAPAYAGIGVHGTRVQVTDLVFRGIRFKGAHDQPGSHQHVVGDAILSFDADCAGVAAPFQCEGSWDDSATDGGITRVVLDHVVLATLRDKMTLWGKISDVTIQRSLFYRSPLAFLVSYYAGPYDLERRNISVHHNVFTQNNERNPQLRGWIRNLDVRNNIIHAYDWFNDESMDEGAWPGDGYGIRVRNEAGEDSVHANIVANVFHPPDGLGNRALIYGTAPGADVTDGGPATCLTQGEVFTTSAMGDLWVADNDFPAGVCDVHSTVNAPLVVAPVTTHATAELCAELTGDVGVPFPSALELDLLEQIRNDLGCITADAGEVPDGAGIPGVPLRVTGAAPAGRVALSWSRSCQFTATDFALFEGEIGSFNLHELALCTTMDSTSIEWGPTRENSYFLVGPVTSGALGGLGFDSSGAPRPAPGVDTCWPARAMSCP